MKYIFFILTTFVLLNSCTRKSEKKKEDSVNINPDEVSETMDTINELPTFYDNHIFEYSEYNSESNEIPPDGKYRFDIAFAEWEGISMGEKVTVIISGDSIKIVYEGDGQLTLTEKGEIIDEGKIMKHKSGNWIIGTEPSDIELEEVGGCSDGPAIIDFKNKKYWMC